MGGSPLAIGEGEGQCGHERPRGVHLIGHHHPAAEQAAAARPLGSELEQEELLEGDALPGTIDQGHRLRRVQMAQRVAQRHQPLGAAHRVGEGVGELVGDGQQWFDALAQEA